MGGDRMLDAIFSCKLFKASPRKDKICSALNDATNKELVQQLRSYLDEPYRKPEYLSPEDENSESNNTSEDADLENNNLDDIADESFNVSKAGSRVSSKPPSEDEPSLDESSQPDDIEEPEAVQESINIKANECLLSKLKDVISELKGSLNLRSDTSGVNRIMEKENELWLYYDDKINLNNVMAAVIEFINAAGYTFLEFNRLARSDNAIVFQINLVDTNTVIDPIGETNA